MLQAKGLGRIADVVLANVKRSVRLTSGTKSKGARNRLGGAPNLPPELDWPHWKDHPLAFLAQFDLATLPVIEGFDLPRRGSLFFFHEAGEHAPWGYDPQDLGCARVLFSERPLKGCSLRAVPVSLEEERQYRGLALDTSRVEDSIPDSCDQVIGELGPTPAEGYRYEEVWEKWNSRRPDLCHRMAGYPDRLQGDLRLEAQLVSHGLYCGDGTGYQAGKKKKLWAGAKDWELLLQLDSEEAAGMMWGDAGRLYYLIHKDDLRERRFEKVWAGLECM